MARNRTAPAAALGPRPHQTTIFERLEGLARAAASHDPARPAMALFCIVLAA
jgi:hypothetical protein